MKELILLGTGASRENCPFDCETWGVCACYTQREQQALSNKPFRLDKLFITDGLWSPNGTLHFDINRIRRLPDCEVMSLHRLNLGRHKLKTTPISIKLLKDKFNTEYLTSSVCYMIAYAIHKSTILRKGKLYLRNDGYKKFKLYGIDMLTKEEYRIQKGGVEFWLGFARGLGIENTIAEPTSVLKTPDGVPYGVYIKHDLKMIDPYNLLKGVSQ